MPRRALADYLGIYDHEHHHPANKLLHGVGIPMIVGSLLIAAFYWKLAVMLFLGGWALLFLGHRIEGNRPAFFQGVIYFLVGPIWVAKEIKEFLSGNPPSRASRTP